jgi:hypothetical protein
MGDNTNYVVVLYACCLVFMVSNRCINCRCLMSNELGTSKEQNRAKVFATVLKP